MKNIIWAALIFLALSTHSYAQAVPFDYTGNTATFGDDQGGWIPDHTGPISVGGPTLGAPSSAEQFLISSPIDIAFINSMITPTPSTFLEPGQTGSVTFAYEVYSGSKPFTIGGKPVGGIIPDINTLVEQSAYITATHVEGQPIKVIDEQVPFHVELQPGTYWLVEDNGDFPQGIIVGGSSLRPLVSQTYTPQNQAVVPEPPSALLLFSGIAGFLFLSKKFEFGKIRRCHPEAEGS